MKPTLISALTVIAMLLAPRTAHAWWADGHMLIAAVAYQQLTTAERARVDAMLSHHPVFTNWSAGGASPLEIFMRASTWADDIRNYSDESTHPYWHFIDYKLKPKSYVMRPDLQPTNNAVIGIRQLTDWLDDTHLPPPEHAKNLAFLIHFVGDIHQPLHCESLFNSTFQGFADGDKGGNRFMVLTNSMVNHESKLHALWDGRLGESQSQDVTHLGEIEVKVGPLTAVHPRTDFMAQLAKTDPKDWSLESRALAIKRGYKPLPALNGTTNHPVVLPPTYLDDAQGVSETQAALAGYRLADTIKAILAANP